VDQILLEADYTLVSLAFHCYAASLVRRDKLLLNMVANITPQ